MKLYNNTLDEVLIVFMKVIIDFDKNYYVGEDSECFSKSISL
jgi:hypothetical protein